jgi:cyclophilin family peptidyl-prolyl cis-trans isomerase
MVCAVVILAMISIAAESPAAVRAILEVDREAYYAGDPVPVRISLWNDGNTPVDVPAGNIPAGFELYDKDGKKLTATLPPRPATEGKESGAEGGSATRSLPPGEFYGFARDLTRLYPALKEAGTYRLQWVSTGLSSNAVILRVVPKYDPDKDYTARVETDLGVFSLDFLRKDAPIAAKTFIELAQSGFYDGVTFHYVEADRVVASGDPGGTGQGGPGFAIPHERPQVKMLAGTVIMLPNGRPPVNGSVFAILLAPRPDFEGTATGFAQVVDGLDVVKKISEVPATSRDAAQPHRPLQPVRINRVVVKPKAG